MLIFVDFKVKWFQSYAPVVNHERIYSLKGNVSRHVERSLFGTYTVITSCFQIRSLVCIYLHCFCIIPMTELHVEKEKFVKHACVFYILFFSIVNLVKKKSPLLFTHR